MIARSLAALLLSAPCWGGSSDFALETFAVGLDQPTCVSPLPGDRSRLWVTEKSGKVRMVRDQQLLTTPFLDLSGKIDSAFEGGLLSIEAHPDYDQNGRFFVCYTTLELWVFLEEYQVSGDPDLADPTPVQLIYAAQTPAFGAHYGGDIDFGPDGTLVMGIGDQGNMQTAQDLADPRGKLLRFDVDTSAPFLALDNPFVGVPGVLSEIYAYGFRQPWRITFDQATGGLWIGDVGWASREEINLIPGNSGGGQNFGWPCKQGVACNGPCDCNNPDFVDPLIDYTHGPDVNCIIGGHIYRGGLFPQWTGRYFHADCQSGQLWHFDPRGGSAVDLIQEDLSDRLQGISSIDEDLDGELLVVDMGDQSPGTGALHRIVPSCEVMSFCTATPNGTGVPASLAATGSTSVSQNALRLEAEDMPPGGFALFFYGQEPVQVPFGNGFRCVGPGGLVLFRLGPPAAISAGGVAVHDVDFQAPPMATGEILPGSTWYFQSWYRDPGVGAGFNLTDGVRADFCP